MGKTKKDKVEQEDNIKNVRKQSKTNRKRTREVLSKIEKGLIDPEEIDDEDY